MPYITNKTISNLMELHFSYKSDLSFATLTENNPYTIVERDEKNNVISVSELKDIPPHERPKKVSVTSEYLFLIKIKFLNI